MGDSGGLRERRKRQMYRRLSDTAIALFLEKGFEKVTVAEVAAAVEVSKPTLFRYFPAKEDLVLHRIADHEGEAARVVAARPAGHAPLEALRRHFLAGLARREPVTGLNDEAEVLAFHRLLFGTPSLVARLHGHGERDEEALAEALTEALAAEHGDGGAGWGGGAGGARGPAGAPGMLGRLAAGQIVAVQRVLARENWRRMTAGESADQVHPEAVRAAEAAYTQLRSGLAAPLTEEPGERGAEERGEGASPMSP